MFCFVLYQDIEAYSYSVNTEFMMYYPDNQNQGFSLKTRCNHSSTEIWNYNNADCICVCRRVMIILEVTVIAPGTDVQGRIGTPQPLRATNADSHGPSSNQLQESAAPQNNSSNGLCATAVAGGGGGHDRIDAAAVVSSCCSTDSERPCRFCHLLNKVGNIDHTPDIPDNS